MIRRTSLSLLVALGCLTSTFAQEEPAPAPEPATAPAEEPAEQPAEGPQELQPLPEPESKPEDHPLDWAFATFGGLTGTGELVTGHSPRAIGIRAGFVFAHQELEIRSRPTGPTGRLESRAELYLFQVAVGIVPGLETSLSVPVIDLELRGSGGLRDDEAGFGNPELGLKYTLPLGLEVLSLAPYTRVMLPWGENDLFRPERALSEGKTAEWELGLALSGHVGKLLTASLNLAFRELEGGTPDQSFRFRFGVEATPLPFLKAWLAFDGEEFEGGADANMFITMGVGALIFEHVTLSMQGRVLIEDSGYDGLYTAGSGDEVDSFTFSLSAGCVF